MEKRDVPNLPPVTLAYIAGLIDGEGTITIRRISKRSPNSQVTFAVMIEMAQRDREILDWVRATLQCGSVAVTRAAGYGADNVKYPTAIHKWTLAARLAAKVIAALLPYLRIKRRQAEIALQMQAIKDDWVSKGRRRVGTRGTLATPPEVLSEYQRLCAEVQTLNGRGARWAKAPEVDLGLDASLAVDVLAHDPTLVNKEGYWA